MPRLKRKYRGELAQPLLPVRIGLLMTDVQRSLVLLDRYMTEMRKLELLIDAHGVERGPSQWKQLALSLARENVPGFRDAVRKGRPVKWSMLTLWILAGEMTREMEGGAESHSAAARRLAIREPWSSFLADGKWNEWKAVAADSSDALLEQYVKMAPHCRSTGEDAYHYHTRIGTLEEWDATVVDVLKNPPATN